MSQDITLERDGHDQPWGFRLQGGVDVGMPLSILRVLVGTPSESVLKKGDIVTKISQTATNGLSHQKAVDLFNSAGNQINITIKRNGSGGVVPTSSQPSASSLQATAAIRQQQQQQQLQQSIGVHVGDTLESPQVQALPRTTFVLKSDLPITTPAPKSVGTEPFSVQNQPYRTLPLVQPSVKVLTELGVGTASHLRLQEDICTGVREPQLVPITTAQANALKANDFIMKQKVPEEDPSVSIRSLLRPVPYMKGRPAWKETTAIRSMGRNMFSIGGQTLTLKSAAARIIPGQPYRGPGSGYKPKPIISQMMWRNMLKKTPLRPKKKVKVEKEKREVLPDVVLRKEKVINIATRDIMEEYCNQVIKNGLPGKKYKPKDIPYVEHEGIIGPAKSREVEVKFKEGKRRIEVTVVIRRFEEYEDCFTVGDKNNVLPGPCASFTFSMDYLNDGVEVELEPVMPEMAFDEVEVQGTVNICPRYDPMDYAPEEVIF